MVALDTNTSIELTVLEGFEPSEVKCESKHATGSGPCTFTVVARKISCRRGFLICQSSYEWNLAKIAGSSNCDACGNPCADCWKVFPI